jgi:hypothetical protein
VIVAGVARRRKHRGLQNLFHASGANASELEVNEFLGLAQKRQAACEGRSY